MLKIACIGEVMIELVDQGQNGAHLGVAGDTYNTAVYLAQLLDPAKFDVSYVTALGSDLYSDRIIKEMKWHNLDTSFVERRGDKMPGLYAINTDDNGERSFAYWRSNSAARTLFSDPNKMSFDVLNTFDVILLSGISIAILPSDVRNKLRERLAEFRQGGGTVAFDSNYRSALWESKETARNATEAFWRCTDIALPSIDDETTIFGDHSEEETLQRFAEYGCREGALKRGADGPRPISGQHLMVTYSEATEIVDTTAAGDSFNAGYIAAKLTGEDTNIALQQAHDLACKVIGRPGAIVTLP